MPTYEYECDRCSFRFEVKRSFTENGGNVCPVCGSESRQIYFPTPLLFKGSGFYITDSRKKSDNQEDGGQLTKPDMGKPTAKSESVESVTKSEPGKPKAKPETSMKEEK